MSTTTRTALGAVFSSFRSSLYWLLLAGLIVTNLATVLSERVHDALFGAVSSIASVGGAALAQKMLAHSPSVRKAQATEAATRALNQRVSAQEARLKALDQQHANLSKKHAELDQRHASLNKKHAELDSKHRATLEANRKATAATKAMASRARTRLVRNVARNTGALAAEALPALGLAVAIGVTALDVHDACEAIKDWNENLTAHDLPAQDTTTICGVRIPTKAEILSRVGSQWQESADSIKRELDSMSFSTELIRLQPPTLTDIRGVTCPVVKLPGFCT